MQEMRIYWRGALRLSTNLWCDTPIVDLSRDRTALSGKFPEDELKAGRELELRNMLNFDAFDLVEELPPGKHAYDMVWVDEWRGDRVRSRLCVRQFKVEGLRDDLFAGTPDTFFITFLLAKAASCKDFGILVIGLRVDQGRVAGRLVCGNTRHVFHQVFSWQKQRVARTSGIDLFAGTFLGLHSCTLFEQILC